MLLARPEPGQVWRDVSRDSLAAVGPAQDPEPLSEATAAAVAAAAGGRGMFNRAQPMDMIHEDESGSWAGTRS
jgi:hypothetical protein